MSSTDDMEREPRPIRVILFSPHHAEPAQVTTIEDSDFGIWQALGNAQSGHVFLRGVRAAVLCDENGKAKRLPPNRDATLFVDHYVPGFARADTIVGPALVVGLDDEGWHPDVPEDVVHVALPDPAEGDGRREQRFLTVDGAGAPLIHLPLADDATGA